MLIRLACSWTFKKIQGGRAPRPYEVSVERLRSEEDDRDSSLAPYAGHILDVLNTWYPSEYEMLELLCAGHVSDYQELAEADPQLREHLQGYGLVHLDAKTSVAASGMISDYVRQASKRKGGRVNREAMAKPAVSVWSAELESLADGVVHSRAYCQELAHQLGIDDIFDDDKFRIGAKLADLRVTPLSSSREQFESASNTLQQLFWDAVPPERRRRVESEYPAMYSVMNSVRSLRHWLHHPELTVPEVQATTVDYVQSVVGGFPSSREDWARLHIQLMRDLIAGLKDMQGRMFSARRGAK